MFLLGFPLLLIPFAIYNIVVFLMPGVSLADPAFVPTLPSRTQLEISAGDLLVALAILLLWVEILKARRPGMRTGVDNFLSLALFLVMLAELLLVQRAATSTFLLLVAASFVDVAGGLALTARPSRRIEYETVTTRSA
jgi:hypothetical protein